MNISGIDRMKKLAFPSLAKLADMLWGIAQPEAGDDLVPPATQTQATTTSQPQPLDSGITKVQPADAAWVWNPPSRSRPSSASSQSGMKMASFSNIKDIDDDMDKSHKTGSDSSISDDASVVSIPGTPREDGEVELVLSLAQAFWRNGEFANSHALLNKGLRMMGNGNSEMGKIRNFETRMRIAVLFIYRGRYDEATGRLEELMNALQELPASQKGTATNELKRWAALSQMYRGNYQVAVRELKALLDSEGGYSQRQVSLVQIQRDLALASGLLGHNEVAKRHMEACQRMQNLLQSRGTQEEGRLSRSKSWSIQYTEAYIDALWGKYDIALENAAAAYQGLRDHFGSTHLKTLRAATLGVHLLTKVGRYHEAEVQCRKTLQLTDHHLGRMHPLNLETIEGLVDILRSQSRLTEALATAESLCGLTDEALTPEHPQALRARSQLAATHLAIGNYATAELELRKTVSQAQGHLGKDHPETLRFHAELAHVLCYRGSLGEAMAMATDTLRRQRKVYSSISSSPDTHSDVLETVLDEFREPTFHRHPCLVFTLQVIALVEAKQPGQEKRAGQNIDQAERILQLVVWWRTQDLGDQGSHNPLTLAAEYELASVVRDSESVDARLEYVNRAFYHVWNQRRRIFESSHPETLSAEREVIITDCMRGVWVQGGPTGRTSNPDNQSRPQHPTDQASSADTTVSDAGPVPKLSLSQWVDVESVSDTIFVLHEAQLGPHHPETLKSLLWLFSVRLRLYNSRSFETKQTWRQLRERLHHPSVQSERLVEALRMEERVALIFADQHDYLVGLGILHDVVDIISDQMGNTQPPSEHPLHLALSAIRADVQEEMVALLPDVKAHQDRLDMLERSLGQQKTGDKGIDLIATRCEIYQLCKSLVGRRAERTLRAYLALAQARWDSGRVAEQRKGLGALVQLKAQTEKAGNGAVLPQSVQEDIEDRSRRWSASLTAGRGSRDADALVRLLRYETTMSAISDDDM